MRAMSSFLFSLAFIAALVGVAFAVTHHQATQGFALIILFGLVATVGAVLAFSLANSNRRRADITIGGVFIGGR